MRQICDTQTDALDDFELQENKEKEKDQKPQVQETPKIEEKIEINEKEDKEEEKPGNTVKNDKMFDFENIKKELFENDPKDFEEFQKYMGELRQNFDKIEKEFEEKEKQKSPNNTNNSTEDKQPQDYKEKLSSLFKGLSEENNNKGNEEAPSFEEFTKMMDEFMKDIPTESNTENKTNNTNDEKEEEVDKGMLEGLLQTLLNKDFIYEPLKELHDIFPVWLKENKEKLPEEEFNMRTLHFEALQKVVEAYQKDKPFQEIADLMEEMQKFGPPPKEILDKLSPGTPWNSTGLPQMPENCRIL